MSIRLVLTLHYRPLASFTTTRNTGKSERIETEVFPHIFLASVIAEHIDLEMESSYKVISSSIAARLYVNL